MNFRWVVAIAAALSVTVGLGLFKFFEIKGQIAEAAMREEYFETVEAQYPEAVHYIPTVTALGIAVAPNQVTLRNELAGYITAVNFPSGSKVEQGEVILQLDISEQLANLDSAEARAKLAESTYERDVELRKTGAVSKEALERSLTELSVVKAEIAATQSLINRRTIRAPFDGVIGIHQFESGQYLNSNTEITTLVGSDEEMWIDFSVPQFYGELEIGAVVRVRPVRIRGKSGDEYLYATVIAANSAITVASRSRLYRALSSEGAKHLLHNAAVEVEVPVGQGEQLRSLPTQAVRSDANSQYVFALDPEADHQDYYRARSIAVVVQDEQGKASFLAGELSTGDLIATDGSFKLHPGLLVRVGERVAIEPSVER